MKGSRHYDAYRIHIVQQTIQILRDTAVAFPGNLAPLLGIRIHDRHQIDILHLLVDTGMDRAKVTDPNHTHS